MVKGLMKKVLIFSFLLTAGMSAAYSQASGESSGGRLGYLSYSLGYGNSDLYGGKINLTFVDKDGLFLSARTMALTEFSLWGPMPNAKFTDYGFLVGKSWSFRSLHLNGGLGLSYWHWVKRGEVLHHGEGWNPDTHEKKNYGGTGISFEMSAIPNIKFAGLGFSIFGNLNACEPVIGAGITAAVGKFYHGGARQLLR